MTMETMQPAGDNETRMPVEQAGRERVTRRAALVRGVRRMAAGHSRREQRRPLFFPRDSSSFGCA